MKDPTKETVIIIHGTWAAPNDSGKQWYEPRASEPNFVTKLDAALAAAGSQARCWAHCKTGHVFSWSGANSWIDRIKASNALAEHINALQARGWKCHLVAHSHGGNVANEAMKKINNLSSVVTMGTPFIDTMTARGLARKKVHRSYARYKWIYGITALIYGLAFFYFAVVSSTERRLDYAWRLKSDSALSEPLWSFFSVTDWSRVLVGALSVISILALVYSSLRSKATKAPHSLQTATPWLSLTSSKDEAWQLLHHIRSISSPLSRQSGIVGHVVTSYKVRRKLLSIHARLLGYKRFREQSPLQRLLLAIAYASLVVWTGMLAASAYYGMRAVFEWCEPIYHLTMSVAFGVFLFRGVENFLAQNAGYVFFKNYVGALAVIPSSAVEYLVRARGWRYVQQAAMGLEGFNWELPQVTRAPAERESSCCISAIDADVELRALSRRNKWAAAYLDDLSEVLSQMVLTAADVSLLVKLVSEDASLVHASYYTDDACIRQVADWIAKHGSEATEAGGDLS